MLVRAISHAQYSLILLPRYGSAPASLGRRLWGIQDSEYPAAHKIVQIRAVDHWLAYWMDMRNMIKLDAQPLDGLSA